MTDKILLVVVGPTGIGKTSLSIALAKHFHTEITSSDSRQFYKEMTIGTAVPSMDELNAAPHHFIQNLSIKDAYSVGDFERDAILKLKELFYKYKVVVMVGGSGLYLDAVTKGLDDFPVVDPGIRQQLMQKLENTGIESLQEQMQSLDFETYHKIDIQNPHRLIRALEICIGTGKPYSSFLTKKQQSRAFKSIFIGLTGERSEIYDRINQRVDGMMVQGLLEEVKELKDFQNLNALNTVGYKELFSYLKGEMDLEMAISEIKKNSRRYAKRQLTWLRKNEEINWFDYKTDHQKIASTIENLIANET